MKKILAVDDDQNICILLNKFLSKKGYQVFTANDGVEAVKILQKEKVDLILCDFRLPDEDGLELLGKFKDISPQTQVIIITGYSHVKIAVQAIKAGAYDYVTKPFRIGVLLARLASRSRHDEGMPSVDQRVRRG